MRDQSPAHSLIWLAVLTHVLLVAGQRAHAFEDDLLAELVALLGPAPAYSADGVMETVEGGSGQFAIRVRIAPSWSRFEQSHSMDGLGASLIEARHGTYDRTTQVHVGSARAIVNDQFELQFGMPIERMYSPAPVIRMLRDRPDLIASVELDTTMLPRLRYRVAWQSPAALMQARIYELDFEGTTLEGLRELAGDGTVLMDVGYTAWSRLDTGESVPVASETVMPSPSGVSSPPIKIVFELRDPTSIDPNDPSHEIQIPSGFAVLDYLRGVSLDGNGRVIGEIETGAISPTPSSTPDAAAPGGQVISVRTVLFAVAAVFLLGGAVWWYRARAAGR